MFGFLLPEELHQEAAHMGGVSLQLLLLQDIQDGQPHSAGHWAAPKLSQGTEGMSDAQQSGPHPREGEGSRTASHVPRAVIGVQGSKWGWPEPLWAVLPFQVLIQLAQVRQPQECIGAPRRCRTGRKGDRC